MKVGWIGLGSIGTQMALRAMAAGHSLVAYDRGAGRQEAVAAGARLTGDYRELAAGCDVLGVCVFSDAQVREALIDSGAVAAMRSGAVIANHTTGSPALAREIAALCPQGVGALDACFSGSADDTARGGLTIMAGGEAAALETALPVLETYASRISHMGPSGAGQTIKLLNNLLFATNLKQASEIIAIAQAQGLDTALAAQVICQSSGGSMAMGLLQGGSAAATLAASRPYMVKDVAAAVTAARESGLDIETFAPTVSYFTDPAKDVGSDR